LDRCCGYFVLKSINSRNKNKNLFMQKKKKNLSIHGGCGIAGDILDLGTNIGAALA